MLELKKSVQSPADALRDKVYAAMETGNPAAARTALAEADSALYLEVGSRIKFDVMKTYGVRL